MKQDVKRFAAIGAAGLLLAAALVYSPSAAESWEGDRAMAAETASVTASEARTISVTGEGKITVEPDVAYVNFGVVTQGQTANEAQTENAKKFSAIEKVLKEQFNVAAADIKTSGFYVNPNYDYSEKGQAKIVGYTASHTVTVTYRDLDALGKMLDAVSAAGANSVNGIQFGTEKAEEYELQAIEKAMANAKAKADAIAKAAGRSVTDVLHVSHNGASGEYPPIVYNKATVGISAAADSVTTPVQPGELEITTTVSVTYEM